MLDSSWIFWTLVACAALVAVAVLLGRYAASLFLDASRAQSEVEPGGSKPSD